jgi:hypothetical protein
MPKKKKTTKKTVNRYLEYYFCWTLNPMFLVLNHVDSKLFILKAYALKFVFSCNILKSWKSGSGFQTVKIETDPLSWSSRRKRPLIGWLKGHKKVTSYRSPSNLHVNILLGRRLVFIFCRFYFFFMIFFTCTNKIISF